MTEIGKNLFFLKILIKWISQVLSDILIKAFSPIDATEVGKLPHQENSLFPILNILTD